MQRYDTSQAGQGNAYNVDTEALVSLLFGPKEARRARAEKEAAKDASVQQQQKKNQQKAAARMAAEACPRK